MVWNAAWTFASALLVAIIASRISHAIKLADFRQAWINDLRKDVADYLGLVRKLVHQRNFSHIMVLQGAEHDALRDKQHEIESLATEARVIFWRIQMRINPNDNAFKAEDERFLKALSTLSDEHELRIKEPGVWTRWSPLADEAVAQARALLKREWEVTKRYPGAHNFAYLRRGTTKE